MVEYDIIKMQGGVSMLYEYLLDTFGTNEPISVSDIKYGGYSRPWIDKELSKLCKSKKIVRYERGIYYIPSQTPFGASVLNPNKIIKYKYIEKRGKINGFYMGLSALNRYGLTTQVPNTTEICTNNETSKLRSVKVGNISVILRKSRTAITNENVDILSFLELMNNLSMDSFDDEKRDILCSLVQEKGINRQQISRYAPLFPDKEMRNLIESEIIYYVAQ